MIMGLKTESPDQYNWSGDFLFLPGCVPFTQRVRNCKTKWCTMLNLDTVTYGHGGCIRELAARAGCAAHELLDFSANINPLGPPDCVRRVIAGGISQLAHYPDPESIAFREAVGSLHSIPAGQVIAGNGSTEILHALPRALGYERAVIPQPGYIDYSAAVVNAGLKVEHVILDADNGFSMDWRRIEDALQSDALVIIGQPGNPSGAMFDNDELLAVAGRHPNSLFIIDEAFADFVEGYRSLAGSVLPNMIILRSMTKFYAIPGLRLGYAVAPEGIARLIHDAMPPWSVGALAQSVGIAVLGDNDFKGISRIEVAEYRKGLQCGLEGFDCLHAFPSAANYLLVRIDGGACDAPELARNLLKRRIAVRVCDNYAGLDRRYFRIAVRTPRENERFLDSISRELGAQDNRSMRKPARRRRVPAVMFQGTSSNAGKSVLAAALCRILLQDGYRVAPYKSQNMSLNSHVTLDGGEIGRAQAFQAHACRLDPDVRMNPILLKPCSDTGSQVIILGKPVGTMDVDEYIRYKPAAFEAAKQAYDSLASEADVVVVEGAGSPAEVNLRHHDIANMAVADYAKAAVLMVGDIDRGGVFASFVGTMELLTEKERRMVDGFIINRFRGKKDLLDDAIEYVRTYTGLPTLGVVPYIHDLGMPEEDSVGFREGGRYDRRPPGNDIVDIAVVDLPHISNFTDMDPLLLEPDVSLRVVRTAGDLGSPDAIIIPGSKNVPHDLRHLHDSGIAGNIINLSARKSVMIVGICGGFQMLGRFISDPNGIESNQVNVTGLSLMAFETVLEKEKTLTCVSARHMASGLALKGYEIHHGRTTGSGLIPAVVRDDGAEIGYGTDDGRIFGTYLHGLFDGDAFRRWFIDRLRTQRGLAPAGAVMSTFDIEPALDRLADIVRSSIDIPWIYRRMGLS